MGAKGDIASAQNAGGFNCSTSVLTAFCEDYDLDAETAARLACGLGGGCRSGEVCGAVSGAILVVGLKYGQDQAGDQGAKANCYARTVQFLDKFREKYNAITCRELLGADISTDEGREAAQEKIGEVCPGFVKSAADILEELGY